MEERELIIADCVDSSSAVELFSLEEQKSRLVLANESLIDQTKQALEESTGWLPLFAEMYNISAKLKDYILVPTVIMPSDLPNRNGQAFPFEELTRPNPESGLIGYETWCRKPTHIDHKNDDYTIAKGIIFSSSLRPMHNAEGNLHKVVCLQGYDRSRDPILANSILTGERPHYSMGAWAKHFTCSLCMAKHGKNQMGCEHISIKSPRMKRTTDGKLVYLQARYTEGYEISSVSTPAFSSATTPVSMHL